MMSKGSMSKGEKPRKGGVLKKFYTGRLRPEVRPRTLLYTIFGRKDTPFVYLPLTNGTSFTYLVSNFASLSTAVNEMPCKSLSTAINALVALLDFLTDRNDGFLYPFICFN